MFEETVRERLGPLIWRTGRRLYAWARNDGKNSPSVNGEYWPLRQVLARAGPVTLLDVGANLGNWTVTALKEWGRPEGIRVHGFEPSSKIRILLEKRLEGYGEASVHRFALSDRNGAAIFFTADRITGTGSLAPISGTQIEEVEMMTLDTFVEREGIGHVTMVKIDVEGFDSFVIEGASALMDAGRIDLIQFEYNSRWLPNHRSLWHVFNQILIPNYRFGKIVQGSIHGFAEWHLEMDRFFENNYVLIRKGSPFESLIEPHVFDARNTVRRAT